MKLTATIITRNPRIDRLVLDSIPFADQILIVCDSKGTSKTTGKTDLIFHPLENDFSSQRNFALSKAKGDWVLFLDSDEIVGSELQREIKEAIKSKSFSAYYLPRIDTCFHWPLRHGETGHAKIIRLGRKNSGKFVRPVHEIWKIKGRVGELRSPLYHIKDNFISGFLPRIAQYGQIDAKTLVRENKPFTYFRLLMNPLFKFKLNYYFRLGFLDGYPGLFLAYLMSIQSLSVRVFQWTNKQSGS